MSPCVRDAGFYRAARPNPPESYIAAQLLLPTVLCEVLVTIDNRRVPLIYVQERQINFVVPYGLPSGGRVNIRVIYRGISSLPAAVKYGPDLIAITQPEPAYAKMPVWIAIKNTTEARPVGVSSSLLLATLLVIPAGSVCPTVEVTRDGVPLPRLKVLNPPRLHRLNGNPCSAGLPPSRGPFAGRLPLHLLYRFDQPGEYLARYVTGAMNVERRRETSDWTPIHVRAATSEHRGTWLRAQAANAPNDPETLIYDFLPSIFGYGDDATLRIAMRYLHHTDQQVRALTAAYLRSYHTRSTLLPALENEVRRSGTNPEIDRLLELLWAKPPAR